MSFNDQLKANDSSVYSRIIPMSCLMSPTLPSPRWFCQVVSSVFCNTPFLSHRFVLDKGVEPSHPFGHPHLKRARLPFRQSSMNQNLSTLCSYGSSIHYVFKTCSQVLMLTHMYLVPEKGVEPSRPKAPGPKPGVAATFHHSGLLPVRENKGLLGSPPGLILFSPTGLMMTTLPPPED